MDILNILNNFTFLGESKPLQKPPVSRIPWKVMYTKDFIKDETPILSLNDTTKGDTELRNQLLFCNYLLSQGIFPFSKFDIQQERIPPLSIEQQPYVRDYEWHEWESSKGQKTKTIRWGDFHLAKGIHVYWKLNDDTHEIYYMDIDNGKLGSKKRVL